MTNSQISDQTQIIFMNMRTWFHLVYKENEISEAIKKDCICQTKQKEERQASKQKKKKKKRDEFVIEFNQSMT